MTSSYYAVLAGHPAVLTTALDILGADYFIVPSKPGINRQKKKLFKGKCLKHYVESHDFIVLNRIAGS